jgi:hypothetical protein
MHQANQTRRYVPFELPLGRIKGYYIEPEPGFIDPYEAEERKAIQELEAEEEERIRSNGQRNNVEAK